jgi:HEAT repeat protein
MILEFELLGGIGVFAAGLLGAGLGLRLVLRWRHAAALARARRIAARLRQPATTLAAIEDRAAAVEELVEFSDARAAAKAVRELLGEHDAAIRSAAIEVLRGTRALERWRRDARRGGYRAKLRAIEALGEVGDERAVDELLEALGDDDPDIARAASHAICARDLEYACERLAQSLSSPRRRLAETAAASLVRQGEEAVDFLVGQLASENAQARRLAVDALGGVGEGKLKDVLLPLLGTEPDPEVRAAVASALARLDGDAAVKEIQRLARSDPDWFVRARCYSLLAEMNAPQAREFLLDALRRVAPAPAGSGGDDDSVETILEGPDRVRSAIMTGLRLLGMDEEEVLAAGRAPAETEASDPDIEQLLSAIALLRERDAARRAEGARLLADVGPVALSLLERALRDPDPIVRSEAARSLGRIGSGDSLPALAARLRDPDPSVRLAASTALRAVVTREAARELTE